MHRNLTLLTVYLMSAGILLISILFALHQSSDAAILF